MTFQSDEGKRSYLQEYNDEKRTLRDAPANEVELYRELVEEGLSKEWEEAMVAKAYSNYGGDEAFPCDWEASRDLLLKLIERLGDSNPFFHNTLGYIYYYGRCSDGQPDYETAFKYFSVGAANGVFESQYKLADMFVKGLGVMKSEHAAANMISGIYDDNYQFFCKGITASKLADVALRMGGLYENGIGVEKDLEHAYYFYLQAQYAIDLRMMDHDYYGDQKVARSIDAAVERVEKQLPEDFYEPYMDTDGPTLINVLLDGATGMDVLPERRGNDYYLNIKRFAPDEESPDEMLLTVQNLRYCELTDNVEYHIIGMHDLECRALGEKYFVTQLTYNEELDRWEFCHQDRVEIAFRCTSWRFENYGRIDD